MTPRGELHERAREDEAFRALLLRDPREAIADELGAPLPEDLEVEVREEAPGTMYLVLPSVRDLDDAALDEVTGGMGYTIDRNGKLHVW